MFREISKVCKKKNGELLIKNTAFVMTVEQNGKTQWTANIKGDSGGAEQQLQFPAGEYYIRIKPSTWLGSVYTFEVK